MNLKHIIKKDQTIDEYSQSREYFQKDLPGIQEQTFNMFQSRLGLIIEDVALTILALFVRLSEIRI